MRVELGNLHPLGVDRPTITEWTLSGVVPEDAGYTLAECVTGIRADWSRHSSDAAPAWVVSDNPELETAVAQSFGSPVGKPADVNDVYLTRDNAPEGTML